MKYIIKLSILFLNFFFLNISGQFSEERIDYFNGNIKLPASLLIPNGKVHPDAVLLIAGSGPTDMDGNNSYLRNNHLKLLAEEIASSGIAVLRYDKRVVPGNNTILESDLRFEDFISDAAYVLEEFMKDNRFEDFYVLGHSQGSLIGMKISEKYNVKGFISLAGPSESIGQTIISQISQQLPDLKESATIILDSLNAGYEVKQIQPFLLSVFRPSVQAFLRSYLPYNPAEEISGLQCRILIIQGDNDLQINTSDAKNLHKAARNSELVLIEGMNHILKELPADKNENIKSYSNPDMPVSKELIHYIVSFIEN